MTGRARTRLPPAPARRPCRRRHGDRRPCAGRCPSVRSRVPRWASGPSGAARWWRAVGRRTNWCGAAGRSRLSRRQQADGGQQGRQARHATGAGRSHRRLNSSVWIWRAGMPNRRNEARTVAVMPAVRRRRHAQAQVGHEAGQGTRGLADRAEVRRGCRPGSGRPEAVAGHRVQFGPQRVSAPRAGPVTGPRRCVRAAVVRPARGSGRYRSHRRPAVRAVVARGGGEVAERSFGSTGMPRRRRGPRGGVVAGILDGDPHPVVADGRGERVRVGGPEMAERHEPPQQELSGPRAEFVQ